MDDSRRSPNSENYRISWYDDEHTILLCEVTRRWTWEEAYRVVAQMNEWCSTVNHGVYSVYVFGTNANLLPYGSSAISSIRRLINTAHPNDRLVMFANAGTLVSRLIGIASQVYGLRDIVANFRFPRDFEAALQEIEQHKRTESPSVKPL